MNEDEELLRPREVAALLGVRPATIARWTREGRLTPIRTPGGHRRYARSLVRRILNADVPGASGRGEDLPVACRDT